MVITIRMQRPRELHTVCMCFLAWTFFRVEQLVALIKRMSSSHLYVYTVAEFSSISTPN